MKALVQKELRQVLPAQGLLAALFTLGWWFLVLPETVVSPHASDVAELHRVLAGLYLLAGLALGFAQFGLERWNRTQAYLVHRGTGAGGAFAAKLAAGIGASALLIVLPPLACAAGHAVAGTWIAGAPLVPLAHVLVASTTALGGYAVGVFASQLQSGALQRVAFAILGGGAVIYLANLAAAPVESLGHASAARFVLAQVAIAASLLATALALFRAGEDGARSWSPATAAAFAALAPLLFSVPYVVGPASLTHVLRRAAIALGSQVVEDRTGTLHLAERDPMSGWSIRDASGREAPRELARSYDGYGGRGDPFLSLYRPLSTPLHWLGPQDDATRPYPGRAWLFAPTHRRVLTSSGSAWYDVARGRMGAIVRDASGSGRWVEIEVPARMGVSYAEGRPFGEDNAPLLVDVAAGRLWSLEADPGRVPELVERHLPGGQRVLGVERMLMRAPLRVDLHEPVTYSSGLAVLGERGAHLWNGRELGPIAEIDPTSLEDSALEADPTATAWTLVPCDVDGLGYRLEVRDVATGAVQLEAEYRARGVLAGLMRFSTLCSAPAAALVSWTRPPIEARAADATPRDPFGDPLLAGRARGGLLLAVLCIGVLLAAYTWTRLGRLGTPPLARALWTAGVLCLGISAWVHSLVFLPSRGRAPVPARRESPAQPRMEIVTA